MSTDEVTYTDWELWVLLHQASDAVAKVREFELEQLGSSMMQAAIIAIMKRIGAPATTAQITKWLLREHHTVAALLDRMLKHGLIKTVEDPKNKKRKLFTPSEKGEELYIKSRDISTINRIFSLIGDKKGSFGAQLRAIRDKSLEVCAELKARKNLPFP